MSDVLVANRHTAPMIFPRTTPGGLISTIIIPPGTVEPIPIDFWDKLKATKIIAYYLDCGHLVVVDKNKTQGITEDRTSDPPVPDHLQDPEQDIPGPIPGKKTRIKSQTRHVEIS